MFVPVSEGQHQRSQGRPAADLPYHLLPLVRRQVPCRSNVADQDLPCRQTDARLERRCIVRRLVELIKGMLSRLSCFAGLGGMVADGCGALKKASMPSPTNCRSKSVVFPI